VNAWIGQGVTIEGRVSSGQDLRIDGKVKGTIDVPQHELVLGASAEVKANVTARTLLVAGTLVGDVMVTERLQLQATGSIEGNVVAARLIMMDGATLRGKIDVEGTRAREQAAKVST
jgi:cytoskeletal protein CcmA (bactofilin family)